MTHRERMGEGRCPRCDQWVRLRWDGVVKDHDDQSGKPCSGGRFAPLETRP